MEIKVIDSNGRSHPARVPFDGADHVLAQVCCGKIVGSNPRAPEHDTYESDAHCACGKPVGKIRVRVSTIFGIEEDERVLYGRCRVY